MVEKIKLEESFIGNIMIVTYDSYNPYQDGQNDLFETVVFSPATGRKVFYSKEENEAIITHEKVCKIAKKQFLC